MKNLFRTILALGIVPLLWPATFMGLALTTDVINPLLGGLQNMLYLPGLVWLVVVFFMSLSISALMRCKLSNSLFLIVAVGATVLAGAAFVGLTSWQTYKLIGQKGVIYPNHFDWSYAIDQLWHVMLFAAVVSLVTAIFFIGAGGLKVVQHMPK